jgi:CheY-like chemotaxis protein
LKKNILIVEDEAINAMLIKNILKDDHNILGICTNGEDAIEQINEQNPDFIIMDIFLDGELTGIEVMEKIIIRKNIPHIYCTAYTDESILEKARKTKPVKIIVKPLRVPDIKELIDSECYNTPPGRKNEK